MKKDVVIVGGGIAGVSAAYFLSEKLSVALVERESTLGAHSSGRSAAQYTLGIAANTMRSMAAASKSFLESPPPGFSGGPLLTRRGCLTVARAGQEARLQPIHDQLASVGARAQRVDAKQTLALFPALVAEHVAAGLYEPDAMDLDINALMHGYASGAKARGAQFVSGAPVTSIERKGGVWVVRTAQGTVEAPMLLNAAGAWADEVAALAGQPAIGVTALRRTAFTFVPAQAVDADAWPFVSNLDYQWYVRPESGRLLGSLAESVPTAPGNVTPNDVDVAKAIRNIEQDTSFRIAGPIAKLAKWAGLRTFVADKNPVVGTRPGADGFYWLAAQGGCGILASPALAQAATALMRGDELPTAQRELGVTPADLAPDRLTLPPFNQKA